MDIQLFSNKLDLVIIDTINYRECSYENRQKNMIPTSTLDDIVRIFIDNNK